MKNLPRVHCGRDCENSLNFWNWTHTVKYNMYLIGSNVLIFESRKKVLITPPYYTGIFSTEDLVWKRNCETVKYWPTVHKYCEILCSSRVSVILYIYFIISSISSPLFLCLMKDFNLSQLCVIVPSGCVVNMAVTLTGISCSWENHHQSAALVLLALLKKDVDEFCFYFNWNNIKYCMQYIILTFSPNFLKWI